MHKKAWLVAMMVEKHGARVTVCALDIEEAKKVALAQFEGLECEVLAVWHISKKGSKQ